MDGGDGNDTLSTGSNYNAYGSGYNFEGTSNTFLTGGAGNDVLADGLNGFGVGSPAGYGAYNDTLDGGAGNDILASYGNSTSVMTGGAGNDLFFVDTSGANAMTTEHDVTITDFVSGQDRIGFGGPAGAPVTSQLSRGVFPTRRVRSNMRPTTL